MKRATYNHFAEVPRADIQRSKFDCSHGYKTTLNAGLLIPVYVDEALPGDTFSLNMTAFARLATPLKPIMDTMWLESFFFFVPNRLIWENWQRFNGEQDSPTDSVDYLIPQINDGISAGQDIYDYMGIPPGTDFSQLPINSLHLRAYNLIWHQFFRDENLQGAQYLTTDDGPDTALAYELLRRGKRHDYFTSCLPFPQKGEDVVIPLGNAAPVEYQFGNTVDRQIIRLPLDGDGAPPSDVGISTLGGAGNLIDDNNTALALDPNGTLFANLSEATSATINQLRESFQIQKMYERDARGGTRYTEIIASHFGVTSPDARLQRPEYLGGGSTTVNITQVPQTSQSDPSGPDASPQGNLAGFGTAFANNHGFTKSFTEHGVLVGLVCVRADLTYQQGVKRMWSRQTRFDFYWPALSHLGEMEVLNKEIFVSNDPEIDDAAFGYQERYAEYRYHPSMITGKFRSTDPESLDIWHLSQDFATLPTLSNQFIQENPPIDRIIAVPDEPQFLFDSYFKLTKARPMPTYAVPGLIDHF